MAGVGGDLVSERAGILNGLCCRCDGLRVRASEESLMSLGGYRGDGGGHAGCEGLV